MNCEHLFHKINPHTLFRLHVTIYRKYLKNDQQSYKQPNIHKLSWVDIIFLSLAVVPFFMSDSF